MDTDSKKWGAVHPSQPWIYFCTEDTIGKYNEATGNLYITSTVGIGSNLQLLFWPPDSVIVGTEDGLFATDENLGNWQNISNGVVGEASPMISEEFFQAAVFNGTLYCRDLSTGGVSERHSPLILSLQAYPNPTNSMLTISSQRSGQVKVYNLLGQEVIRTNVLRGVPTSVYLGPLPSGPYFLTQTDHNQPAEAKAVFSVVKY